MGRKATNIEEQITLLKNRNMILDYSEAKVSEILLDIGYYRLGFYWHHFEIDKDHNFREGTKLSDVLSMYYLDVDLRTLILRYLNRIEINFRTQIIYRVSNEYKYDPFWFSDKSVVQSWFLDSLPIYYSDNFINNNKAIKAHHQKYHNDKFAPAWKTLEFMSFGFNLKLYTALKRVSLKEEISDVYGVRNIKKFLNHFEIIILIRNICAHGATLYDFTVPKGISSLPFVKIETKERHTLSGAFKIISYYLSRISVNRKNDFELELNNVLQNDQLSPEIKHIIETKMTYNLV